MILVADDHADVRVVVKTILERSGFAVELAADGIQALSVVRETPPELIILDIMMPRMNGFEVLAQLRGAPQTRNIPVMLLTAKSLGDDVTAGFRLGADYYIAKPFEVQQLINAVRTLLGSPRAA
jgi:CheY-like chemotaxis protein